ncbi:hypothetical protein ACFX2H_043609 [Malus domestica]
MPNLVAVVQAENTKWGTPKVRPTNLMVVVQEESTAEVNIQTLADEFSGGGSGIGRRWTDNLRHGSNLGVGLDSTKFGGWIRPNPKFPQTEVQVARAESGINGNGGGAEAYKDISYFSIRTNPCGDKASKLKLAEEGEARGREKKGNHHN